MPGAVAGRAPAGVFRRIGCLRVLPQCEAMPAPLATGIRSYVASG